MLLDVGALTLSVTNVLVVGAETLTRTTLPFFLFFFPKRTRVSEFPQMSISKDLIEARASANESLAEATQVLIIRNRAKIASELA